MACGPGRDQLHAGEPEPRPDDRFAAEAFPCGITLLAAVPPLRAEGGNVLPPSHVPVS